MRGQPDEVIPTGSGEQEFAFEEADVFKSLPKWNRSQALLDARLRRDERLGRLTTVIEALPEIARTAVIVDHFEVLPKLSGRTRASAVAHITIAGTGEKVGVAVETAIAHALVDLLLGYDRPPADSLLQLTPSEWGILTFLFAKVLRRLSEDAGRFAPTRLILDRVSPDPPDFENAGTISTARWSLRLAGVEGSLRAWFPAGVSNRLLETDYPALSQPPTAKQCAWNSEWRVEVGTIHLSRGVSSLRVKGVLPLRETTLVGPAGAISGTARAVSIGGDRRYWIPGEIEASPSPRFVPRSDIQSEIIPREPRVVKPVEPSSPRANPGDLPVTVVVELGRLNIPLGKLADLRSGDVLELGRHTREPVELTSNGRLIARGELVQIDEELGLRVTGVFL